MQDWTGTKIVVGDRVAFAVRIGRSATRAAVGTVVDFNDTRVKVHAYHYPREEWNQTGPHGIKICRVSESDGWHNPLGLTVVS